MFKVLACDHFHNFCIDNILEDEYFEVHINVSHCPHDKEMQEHVFVPCNLCLVNFSHPEYAYFYANPENKCFCKTIPKDTKCLWCVRLKNGINIRVLKIFMMKETFPTKHFSYIDLNEYLKKLRGEVFFYFNVDINRVEYLIDHPDWCKFFYDENDLAKENI